MRNAYEFLRSFPEARPAEVDTADEAADDDARGDSSAEHADFGAHRAGEPWLLHPVAGRPGTRAPWQKRWQRAMQRARRRAHDAAGSRLCRLLLRELQRVDTEAHVMAVNLLAAEELRDPQSPLRTAMTPDMAVWVAKHGPALVVERLLGAHLDADDLPAATALVEAIAGERAQDVLAAIGGDALRILPRTILLWPTIAERLLVAAHAAHPALSYSGTRDFDERQHASQELGITPVEHRLQIDRALRAGPDAAASDDVERAVQVLTRLHPAAPVMTHHFLQVFPDLRPRLTIRTAVSRRRHAATARPKRDRSVLWFYLGIALLAGMARILLG